jgi:hypothetical protein
VPSQQPSRARISAKPGKWAVFVGSKAYLLLASRDIGG